MNKILNVVGIFLLINSFLINADNKLQQESSTGQIADSPIPPEEYSTLTKTYIKHLVSLIIKEEKLSGDCADITKLMKRKYVDKTPNTVTKYTVIKTEKPDHFFIATYIKANSSSGRHNASKLAEKVVQETDKEFQEQKNSWFFQLQPHTINADDFCHCRYYADTLFDTTYYYTCEIDISKELIQHMYKELLAKKTSETEIPKKL